MRLVDARKEKGYTQTELGDMVGVSQQQIAKYEAGKSMPPKGIILKLMEILGLTSYEAWEVFYGEPMNKMEAQTEDNNDKEE